MDECLAWRQRHEADLPWRCGLACQRGVISSLERGLKSQTLKKVDELAEVIGVHPLTLLTLSYVRDLKGGSGALVLEAVAAEVDVILNLS